MIQRIAESELRFLATQYGAVVVTGPRQSGKTTLVRMVFWDMPYVNLENPDVRAFAASDPRGFLSTYSEGAILDEIQRVPVLFSYLQQVLDDSGKKGLFILTGSNNFLLQEGISQSLAGRVGYLFLLPLSLEEIVKDEASSNAIMFKGGFPAVHHENLEVSRFYANYIRTYVERDVRLLKNITDMFAFERFIRLCAARTANLLNMSNLAMEVGVDMKTISSWIGVLETSFIAFRLYPYHQNFKKRVVKTPKLYFYDPGLAASLMGIESPDHLAMHAYRGMLFENLVVVDFLKWRYNNGKTNNLFFWRDNTGNEIDLILDRGDVQIPVEIKSGQTLSDNFFKGLRFWRRISGSQAAYLVYDGEMSLKRSDGITVVPLKVLCEMRKSI